ncbi:MAG: hypothetical protein ACRC0U_03445 [Vibrio sp.]
MQIRRSLRIYFLAIMLLVGAMTILFMSGIAVSYFFSGMDMAIARTSAHARYGGLSGCSR